MSEIAVKLTGDNSEFRSMLDQSTTDAQQFAGKIADKVGDKLYGMKDISNAVATALGINLEKISENIARVFSGMSKEEEEAYKKLAELSDQIAEKSIANMRARLTDEQKLTLAIQERDALQEKVETAFANTAAKRAEVAKNQLKLEEKSAEVIELQAAIKEKSLKAQEDAQKNLEALQARRLKQQLEEEATQLKLLSFSDRKKLLAQEESDLRALVASGLMSQAATEEKSAFIAKEKNKLLEEEAKYKKSIALSDEETLRLYDLQQKKKRAMLSGEEAEELRLLTLQSEQKKQQVELTDLIQKIILGTLTPADKARLDELEKQKKKLDEQIDSQKAIIANAKVTLNTESQVTTELESQARARQQMTSVEVSGAPDYASMSTAALTGLLQRYQQVLTSVGGPLNMAIGNYTMAQDYGSFTTASTARAQIGNIEAIVARRKDIGTYAARYGETQARVAFGDSAVNQALRDSVSVQTNTLNTLNTISSQLSSAGLSAGVSYGTVWLNNGAGGLYTGYYKQGANGFEKA